MVKKLIFTDSFMNIFVKNSLRAFATSLFLLSPLHAESPAGGAGNGIANKGIGPVKSIELKAIDPALVAQGKAAFSSKCSACHKLDGRYVGPSLGGVTKRRSPEWIMNMILNPQEMTQKDPDAQELFGEYLVQMTFQNVSESDARGILEYLREHDK